MRLRFTIFTILFAAITFSSYAQLSFKGGSGALDRFLADNIIYPEYSRQNCISGTIQVRFKVDATGKVNDISVLKGLGIDLDDEAMRVVKMTSGKWLLPADYNENSNIVLPIRFNPDRTRCGTVTDAAMASAIANYQSQQELQNAVTNYYKGKYAGTADPAKEAEVIALKKQLGYDDDFINDVLSQADQKLKQGDKSGACEDWNFIHNIGSNKADAMIARYCK